MLVAAHSFVSLLLHRFRRPAARPRATMTAPAVTVVGQASRATPVAAPSPELRAKAERIRLQLAALYPPPLAPPLTHRNTFEFLCAVVLSAQTTDAKVNVVTPALFTAAPTPQAMAALPVETIQAHIRQLGLSQAKAGYLKALSMQLVERHGGQVPNSFAELEALSGVGHKTASVVMSQAFGVPAFAVDTHIHRLALRWGLCSVPKASVVHVERDCKALFPEHSWADVHLQMIFFGRQHCPAKKHDAAQCPICSWAAVEPLEVEDAAPAADALADAEAVQATPVGKKRAGGGAASTEDITTPAPAGPRPGKRARKVA